MANPSLRIVVVDGDRRVQKLFQKILQPPEFDPYLFDDPCAALVELRDLAPDLIVCADRLTALDVEAFHRATHHCAPLADVPFLFLASNPDGRRAIEGLLGPEDACLLKPVPAPSLLECVRAATRHGARAGNGNGHATLSGQTDRGGLLALLKLCEDARLTGRFKLESRGRQFWVDWLAGLPVGSGMKPAEKGADALERMIEGDGGRYAFEPRPVGGGASGNGSHGYALGAGPPGRFSVLEVGGRRYQVHTEGLNAPNFSVATVVAAFGRGLRKVETLWPHPMKRNADVAPAREQIDRQHESVMRMVQEGALAPQPRRAVWDVAGGGVEGSLLVWVMSLLRDLARERIGLVPAVGLLRQSRRELVAAHAALARFEVDEGGRIRIHVDDAAAARTTLSGWRLPKGAVEAVAAWSLVFRAEVNLLAGPPRLPSVRRATRMLARELDEMGFYAALAHAGDHKAQ
jgi:DNA-binding response OmpR family regulator